MASFNQGFSIKPDFDTMNFIYGEDTFGPVTEKRYLDDIRSSLSDPNADGPALVYSVAMDVGKKKHLRDLQEKNLLYGAMIYAGGRIGDEPVRSQGHIHAVSASCRCSTPEVYEIWSGEAIIYMQESIGENAGQVFAIHAMPGDVVIVPEGWAHCTINASNGGKMTFGAWCVRDYGFDYTGIRAHGGIAFFPYYDSNNELSWKRNETYSDAVLHHISAPNYADLGLVKGVPIYTQYENNPDLFRFVVNPSLYPEKTDKYLPKGV